MANLLTIDDHPGLLPDQVSHVFHAPARRVEIAPTGAEGLQRVADVRLDVSSTCAYPTSPAWKHQIDARIPVVPVTVVRSADAAIGASTSPGRSRTIRPRTSRPSI
jgi:hypothetical protein